MADNTNKSPAREDLEIEIQRIIERGGYTQEERLLVVQSTIDLALARARNSAIGGETKGAFVWPGFAEKMQAVLANIEARKTDSKPIEINLRFAPIPEDETTDGPDA